MEKIVFLFVIGSILGYLIEVLFKFISHNDLSSGLSKGPFCMLYGIGTILLSLLVSNYINNIFMVFILSAIILTLIEYLTGIILNKIFNISLWDYSNMKFSINNYICLEFFIIWGILGVIFVYFISPILNSLYLYLSANILVYLIYFIFFYIILDYIIASYKLITTKLQETPINSD